MKEKKQSQDWYIAATHWLTAGFAIPFLLVFVLGVPALIIIGKDNIVLLTITSSVAWILSLWLGIVYSAKYLAKTYVIKNRDNIVKLATIYLAVIGGGFRLAVFFAGAELSSVIELGFFIVGVVVFYFLSKKYVQNNETMIVLQ